MAESLHGAHLVLTLVATPSPELRSRVAGILDTADDGTALAMILAREGCEFAIVQRSGRLLRAQLGGASLRLSVERGDGTTVLFAAPALPAWSTVVEGDVFSAEVVDAILEPADDATVRIAPVRERTRSARLEFDDGRVVSVGGTTLLGRSPRVERTSTAALPDLVPVPDVDGAISRTHLKVSIEDGRVLLEDLRSTNGTSVTPSDGVARRLEPGVPAQLSDGMVVSIADRVAFRVVGLP